MRGMRFVSVAMGALAGTALACAATMHLNAPPPTTTLSTRAMPGTLSTAEPSPTLVDRHDAAAHGVASATIYMINSMDIPVTVAYESARAAHPTNVVPLIGAVQNDVFQPQETKAVIMPQDFSGMAVFGINDGQDEGVDIRGTKWEASLMFESKYVPNIDVSLVDGFSVPLTCACPNLQGVQQVVTGCNLDLWQLEQCPSSQFTRGVCPNPRLEYPSGPAHSFFAPCAGSAYTFPKDDEAVSTCPGANQITCCIGNKCPPAYKQRTRYAKEPSEQETATS